MPLQTHSHVNRYTKSVGYLPSSYGMIEKTLTLPWWLGGVAAPWIAQAVGWIVVVTTLIGAGLAIIKN